MADALDNPILREVAAELTTPRLLLRCPRAGDGLAVHAAVTESLAALRAWPASLPWVVAEQTIESCELFCRESHAGFIRRSSLTYLVFERNSSHLVASTGLHRIDWKVPRFEVGYWCRTGAQRRGLTGEAVGALLRYALDELNARRVECITDEANVAARGLAEKVGMQLEGLLHNERIDPSGQLRNTCVYALVR